MRKMKSGPATADLLWARRPPSRDQKNAGPREAATVDGETKIATINAAAEPVPGERRRQKPSRKKALGGQRKNGLGADSTRETQRVPGKATADDGAADGRD